MSINVLYFSPVKIHQMFLPVSPIFSDIRFLTSPKFPCRDWTSSSPAAPFHRWPAPPAPQATAPGRRARRWWPWRRSEGHSHGGKTTTRKRWGLPGLVYPKFSEFQIDRRDLIHHDWLMYHKTLQGVDFSFVSVQMRQLSWHHGVGWRERLHSNLAFFTKRIGLLDVPKPKLTARCGKSTISRWFCWKKPWAFHIYIYVHVYRSAHWLQFDEAWTRRFLRHPMSATTVLWHVLHWDRIGICLQYVRMGQNQ